MAKLTAIQVAEIRRLYAQGGITMNKLGNMFGCSGTWIGMIVKGSVWREQPSPPQP
jgi:hypothetical protein